MAVEASHIQLRYSTKNGSAGDTEEGGPGTSLGKYAAQTVVPNNVKAALQPGITSDEAESGVTKYQCVFVTHVSATTWEDVKVWVSAQKPGGAEVSIGLDPTGVVDLDDTNPQAVEVADEFTAPAGVTFSNPTTYDDGLEVGDVAAGETFAVWMRWFVAPATAAMDEDSATLAYMGVSEP